MNRTVSSQFSFLTFSSPSFPHRWTSSHNNAFTRENGLYSIANWFRWNWNLNGIFPLAKVLLQITSLLTASWNWYKAPNVSFIACYIFEHKIYTRDLWYTRRNSVEYVLVVLWNIADISPDLTRVDVVVTAVTGLIAFQM